MPLKRQLVCLLLAFALCARHGTAMAPDGTPWTPALISGEDSCAPGGEGSDPGYVYGAPPATAASLAVMQTLEFVEQKLAITRYEHFTIVKPDKGIFIWDCSGMVEWVLAKAAPVARKAVSKNKHPTAKDFHKRIAASPTTSAKAGWIRLYSPEQIAPGDVFAWVKPWFWKKHKNTGHVGFVIGAPVRHQLYEDVWVMRIADATRMLHEDDSRPAGGEGGFGTATIAFLFDGSGAPVAYGWYGAGQDPGTYVPTNIVFGRVTK